MAGPVMLRPSFILRPGFVKSSGEHQRKLIAIGRQRHTQIPSINVRWLASTCHTYRHSNSNRSRYANKCRA